MKRILTAILLATMVFPLWAIFPMQIVNNSPFPDNQVYIAIVSNYAGVVSYYDLNHNTANSVAFPRLTTALNTLHKTSGDWGYADVFVTLDQIVNKTIYIDRTMACRMFISFGSPMYLHVHATGGYAGADLNNPTDPNADVRWEVVEFSYDQYDVMFVNTTRVDAFQYPMAVDLYGNVAAGANNAHMARGETCTYQEVLEKWQQAYGNTIYSHCVIDNRITKDNLGPIIMQPSKVKALKQSNIFEEYIDQIWTTFSSKRLHAQMGERGTWSGKVENDVFVMKNDANPSQVACVARPTTTDVIEGAGAFATGSEIDKAVQAQFCGAMNRGMIDLTKGDNELQNWGDVAKFFTQNTWNEYVRFFHREDISLGKYTYAFAYDDTFDQSSTCATSHPERVVVTIGGYSDKSSEGDDPTQGGSDAGDNDDDSSDEETPSDGNKLSGTTAEGLNYTCTITQVGMDVTYSFAVTNASEFVGLVPVIWDNSNGFREILNVASYTFSNCTEGQVLRVACKWMYAGGDTHTEYISYTVQSAQTGVDNIPLSATTTKQIENGRVVILINGKRYNILGCNID